MKLAVIAIVFVLALPFVAAQLDVEVTKYEPVPAQPGQYVTVYLKVTNTGNIDAPNAALRVLETFPFTTVSADEKRFGLLQSQRSYVQDFRIRVDSQAVVGTNKLTVLYTEDISSGEWQQRELSIQVRPNEAALSIDRVETIPSEVVPGEEVTLEVTLKNTAEIVLRNIDVRLDLVASRGTDFVDYPFIPTDSSAEKTITKLNPGELTTVSFNLKAYPAAPPGYYKMPVDITFFDESGVESTQDGFIGIIVAAAPELEIYFEDSTLQRDSERGTVTLQFVNKGVSDVKFLTIELLETDEYDIVGSHQAYIGDLDSDDYRSETFTISPKTQDFDLELDVEYKDDNNKEYSFIATSPVRYSTQKAQSGSSVPWVIAAIVIVGLIIWWWRRRRRKKK